jgi:hypothetical protein
MNTLSALVSAKSFGMGDTIFQYIEVGKQFRFKDSDEILTKTASRTYRNSRGLYFKTGINTAVFKVEDV